MEPMESLMTLKDSIEAEIRLKTTYSKEALEDLVKDGMAMEDGSYPIVSTEDLENAVIAALHEKSQDIKDHIIKRATEMDQVDLLPELWAEEKAALEAELTAALMEMEMMEIETDIADTE
jgi:Tfp pilus assembly protein PilF